jgi:Kef-type K+ transport system membrane component KefB
MTLSEMDLAQFVASVSLLLLASLSVGEVFARHRQPRVIGEIAGGLLLGPTVLGAVAPDLQVLQQKGPSASALGAIYQLGLIWLMFATGTELRRLPVGRERVAAVSILTAGLVLPFALGLGLFALLQPSSIAGADADTAAVALVFAAAIAVTSIPVISRIMLDLGLLQTPFARVVLGAAVVEDIAMFAVLGIALGITQGSDEFGLTGLLGIRPDSALGAAFYFCVVSAALGAGSLGAKQASRENSKLRRIAGDVRWELLFLLSVVCVCLLMNIPPLFGGLVAGMILGACGHSEATERVKAFGLSFFVPIYFAIVGFRLDLLNAFQPAFFLAFFALACGIKAGSVYLGARACGESFTSARNYAIAMNARGGPGLILASVALDAGIINKSFYASLVMLAILSSLAAGWWLERVLLVPSRKPVLGVNLPAEISPAKQDQPAAEWVG